jgi:hypothetical protein
VRADLRERRFGRVAVLGDAANDDIAICHYAEELTAFRDDDGANAGVAHLARRLGRRL